MIVGERKGRKMEERMEKWYARRSTWNGVKNGKEGKGKGSYCAGIGRGVEKMRR